MKSKRLLRCMTDLDDELILEADTLRFPKKSWAARGVLAACAAAVVILPFLLPQTPPPAVPPAPAAQGEPPAPLPDRPEPPALSDPVPPPDPEDAMAQAPEILRTERMGDLYLGIPAEELKGLLGLPVSTSGQVPVQYADGSLRLTWFYRITGEEGFDLQLSLAEAGAGWFVNEISLFPENPLTLSTGIGLGSSIEDVAAAYPQAMRTQATVYEEGQPRLETYFLIGDARSGLRITGTQVVTSISLGPLLPYPLEGAVPET